MLLNETGNTRGTGFRVEIRDELSFRHTEYEMLTEHLDRANTQKASGHGSWYLERGSALK